MCVLANVTKILWSDGKHQYMYLLNALCNIIYMPCHCSETFPLMSHHDVPTLWEVTRVRGADASTGCPWAIQSGEEVSSSIQTAGWLALGNALLCSCCLLQGWGKQDLKATSTIFLFWSRYSSCCPQEQSFDICPGLLFPLMGLICSALMRKTTG